MEAGKVKSSEAEVLVWDYGEFLSTTVKENKMMFDAYTPSVRLDDFLHPHMGHLEGSNLLWNIVKQLLCLSHGQASVERGFSINKNTVDDNLSETGLIVRRKVIDHISSVGGVMKITIDKSLILAAAGARHKYEQYLSENRKQQQIDKSNKRKLEEEKEELVKKKQKLIEEMSKIES